MKNTLKKIIILTLTFLIGIVAVWFYHSKSNKLPSDLKADKVQLNKSGRIEFKFKRFYKFNNTEYAEFELINGTENDISYTGHAKGNYCTVEYKVKNKIKQSPACCGTGLTTQILGAGETQTFQIWFAEWLNINSQNINQVGFHLYEKNDNTQKTIWSDKLN